MKFVASVMSHIKDLTCSEFSEYLTREGVHEEVIAIFSANRICGETFCDLTEDLKELLPVVGDRVRIRRLLKEAKVSGQWYNCIYIPRVF